MTLTHRATPSCLPSRKVDVKGQYKTGDNLLAAMLADAKAIKARANPEKRKEPEKTVPETTILELVAAKPGITAQQIAAKIGGSANTMSVRMSALHGAGKVIAKRTTINGRRARRFYPTISKRQMLRNKGVRIGTADDKHKLLIGFITDNPGCTIDQIADYLGNSRKAAICQIGRTRAAADRFGVNILTIRNTGTDPVGYRVEARP